MARKFLDCRNFPSDSNCSLTLAGEPEELENAAVEHAISVHGEHDSLDLRQAIRRAMRDEREYQSPSYRPHAPPPSQPETSV
jgi:hypothetical protein